MNLISETHHSCERIKYAFMVFRKYIIISPINSGILHKILGQLKRKIQVITSETNSTNIHGLSFHGPLSSPSCFHNLSINGTNIAEIIVLGRVFCSLTGNHLPNIEASGLAGVNVALVCNGAQGSLGEALTNATGFYNIVLKTVDGITFDKSLCSIAVKLPVGNCTLLPPTGTLTATITLVSIVQTALGADANFLGGLFAYEAL